MPCGAEIGLSVVVFLLDDGRFDQLPYLPLTSARLADHAVVFDRAYVTVPMCCPERASFLSGGWLPQHTGVLTNAWPNGGARAFDDGETLATRLQAAGYATALYGKYLNQYESLGLYVPPGWTDWGAVDLEDPWTDFSFTAGSSSPDAPGVATRVAFEGYYADWLAEAGAAFVADHADEPLFLYLSFRAPHYPHEPPPADEGSLAGFRYRSRAFQEEDVSDKPAWVQDIDLLSSTQVTALDLDEQGRLESLPAIDRAMVAVLDALDAAGRLDDTLVVLTSDNGQQWGEHRLVDKGVAYEESVRVPLVIFHPTFSPRRTDALVAANLDLAATSSDLAGLEPEGDGQSLRGLLCEEADVHRDWVPLQGWPSDHPVWAGLVTDQWKYIETSTGEVELYDLEADPFEEQNIASGEENAALVAEYGGDVAAFRGLAILSDTLPDGVVDEPYEAVIEAWGGEGTLSWSLAEGTLPEGLSLSERGVVSGTADAAVDLRFTVDVHDESVSPYDGSAQFDERQVHLAILPAKAEGDSAVPTDDKDRGCGCGGGSGALGLVALGALRRRRKQVPVIDS